MSKARWAHAALLALALPACATASGTNSMQAHARPAGQAAQPGSWHEPQTQAAHTDYAKHIGPRGQAAQPYAWLGSKPAYPSAQHRLAQDGPSYLGGRAAQPASWTPTSRTSWTLAQSDAAKVKQ